MFFLAAFKDYTIGLELAILSAGISTFPPSSPSFHNHTKEKQRLTRPKSSGNPPSPPPHLRAPMDLRLRDHGASDTYKPCYNGAWGVWERADGAVEG